MLLAAEYSACMVFLALHCCKDYSHPLMPQG